MPLRPCFCLHLRAEGGNCQLWNSRELRKLKPSWFCLSDTSSFYSLCTRHHILALALTMVQLIISHFCVLCSACSLLERSHTLDRSLSQAWKTWCFATFPQQSRSTSGTCQKDSSAASVRLLLCLPPPKADLVVLVPGRRPVQRYLNPVCNGLGFLLHGRRLWW